MNNNKTHHFLTTIMGIIYDYGILKDKYFAVKNTAVMAEGQFEQKTYPWRQVRSFVAWLTQSPGVPVWPASSSPVQCFPLGSVRMRVTLGYSNVYFLSYTGLVVPLM